MMRMRHLLTAALLVTVTAASASAQTKLDPRARVALAQLGSAASIQQARANAEAVTETGMLDVFIRGDVSRGQLEALGIRVRTALPGVFTADVPATAVDALVALPGVRSVEGAAPVELELNASVPATGADVLRGPGPTFTGLNGAGVIVSDIDTGFDYKHGDFRDAANNSRFLWLWDQTDAVGPNPAGYGYGSEWNTGDLTALVARQVATDGHGTHVMGIAGGDGSQTGGAIPAYTYTGMAPMADLVGVKTDLTTTHILDGVAYVFGKATAAGKNAVVNLSLGSHYGPHDGHSTFESTLSSLTGPGRIIVKSAGNERGQARHAEVHAAGPGSPVTMTITGSGAGRAVAIDGYYEATETINVQITTPNGTVIGPIPFGGINAAYPGQLAGTNGYVYVENGASLTTTGAREIYIEMNVPNPTGGAAINGTWTFTFVPVALGAANGEVDLWRFYNSTTTANFATGLDLSTELISEPGNADSLITTAAWQSKQFWTDCGGRNVQFTGSPVAGSLTTFTSPGPTRDGRMKPDIAAPGSAIGSTRSFDIALVCPAGATTSLNDGINHVINAGTSMAAPHTTGASAIIMQKYGAVSPSFIKQFLTSRAIVDGFTGAVPNVDWGKGKLYLGDMVDPTVAVTAPNGGEVFFVGQAMAFTWNATDNLSMADVDLYLSRDGGGSYALVAANVPNSGSYPTTATGPASSGMRLKVVARDAAGNTSSDVSDQDWAILDGPTSTLLSMLAAESSDAGIQVHWQFADPSHFADVTVERSDAVDGAYTTLVAPQTTLNGVTTFVDRTVEAGRTYWYRIAGRTADGARSTFGPISATAGQPVTELALARIAPNPTTANARVDFALPTAGRVALSILDVQGREIARLADGAFVAGRFQATWNGRTERGDAPAGLYFVRLQALGRTLTQRLVVSR